MENNAQPKKLRPLKYYLTRAFRFYDLKNERLTPAVFTVTLFASFLGAFVPPQYFIMNFFLVVVVLFAPSLYLYACIRQFCHQEMNMAESMRLLIGNIFSIVLGSMAYLFSVFAGLFLLIVPGILIALMYMLYNCLIVDKNMVFTYAFRESRNLMKGYKREVFVIFLIFNLILLLPIMIVLYAASLASTTIFLFVSSFIGALINLMQQRLIALVYIDLK